MKKYLNLCLKGPKSITERKVILAAKLKELDMKIKKIQDSINYVHWKQQFYDDVLSGKTDYFSYLLPSKKDK